MTWLLSFLLFAASAVLLFLVGSGGFTSSTPSANAPVDPWGVSLGPLWKLDPVGASLLVTAIICIVLSLALPIWRLTSSLRREISPRVRWSSVLTVSFLINVLLGAFLLLVLTFSWHHGASYDTVGHVLFLELLVFAIGSLLAFALFWLEKPVVLFASTFFVHLAEVGALTAVIVQGIRS
jgi:hypothetical protein